MSNALLSSVAADKANHPDLAPLVAKYGKKAVQEHFILNAKEYAKVQRREHRKSINAALREGLKIAKANPNPTNRKIFYTEPVRGWCIRATTEKRLAKEFKNAAKMGLSVQEVNPNEQAAKAA